MKRLDPQCGGCQPPPPPPGAGLQFEACPSPTCIKPLCVGPVIACPVFDPGEAECAPIGTISASDPTKANPRMRNLASCHRAAYDTQPIMVERRPFVPQGAIAAVRSERMGGCPAPRRCMKCHLHSLDLRQSERAEIPAGKRGSGSPAKGSGRRWTRSWALPAAAHLNLRMVRF